MPTLTLTFPGKRYHATPWGAHVNEGQIEWPPSPWRIYRALLSTGLTKLGWREEALPAAATELLEALTCVLPSYELPPPLTAAHSRHYMPVAKTTSKVFDGFARVGDNQLKIGWDVELSPAAFMCLAELAEALGYLGRAESWVCASAAPGRLEGANCSPCLGPELDADKEPITLLAPLTSADYAAWREGQESQVAHVAGGGRSRGRGRKSGPALPLDILGCLLQSTDDLQRAGWSAPPGSRRVLYARPQDALVAAQPRRARIRAVREPVECALIALTSYAKNDEVLPQLRLALPQMEALHGGLARCLRDRQSAHLTGRADDRSPLQEGHRHAHYLPLSLGDRRRDAT
ncbi:MAG: type I-U CRISPR-associated protein Cas5/Cas6, partial [Myxococcales bacterium]|nr:type I-U CRISPR-associated protein Cas5/Cas6 [Myxococcales bacterium]